MGRDKTDVLKIRTYFWVEFTVKGNFGMEGESVLIHRGSVETRVS